MTIKFWDLVKFKAKKYETSLASARYRLLRDGVRPFGRHYQKLVRVNLSPELRRELQMERILARVRYCECGQIAVARNNCRAHVCLSCLELENRAAFEFPSVVPPFDPLFS